MDSFSHTTVAGCLLDYMEQTVGVTFDRKAFYFGNLKPDLKGEYLTKRHNPSVMFEEVMEKLRNFIAAFRIETCNGAALSEALGEICHYVTDFFTFPHNDTIYEHGLLAHYVYEKRTALCIRSKVNETTFSGYAEEACRWVPSTAQSLDEELRTRHAAYTAQKKHSISDDLRHICGVLAMMVGSLIHMLGAKAYPNRQTA